MGNWRLTAIDVIVLAAFFTLKIIRMPRAKLLFIGKLMYSHIWIK